MATEATSNSALTVDIVCGTLRAKLLTRDLSCGSSRCIEFGSRTLKPCEFQREAGKASAKNWKNTIHYQDQPLSRNLDSFVDCSGKRCCRFIGVPYCNEKFGLGKKSVRPDHFQLTKFSPPGPFLASEIGPT